MLKYILENSVLVMRLGSGSSVGDEADRNAIATVHSLVKLASLIN